MTTTFYNDEIEILIEGFNTGKGIGLDCYSTVVRADDEDSMTWVEPRDGQSFDSFISNVKNKIRLLDEEVDKASGNY